MRSTTDVPTPLLVTARQAQQLLSISPQTLWRLTTSGELPSLKIKGKRLYRRQALESFIAEREGSAACAG